MKLNTRSHHGSRRAPDTTSRRQPKHSAASTGTRTQPGCAGAADSRLGNAPPPPPAADPNATFGRRWRAWGGSPPLRLPAAVPALAPAPTCPQARSSAPSARPVPQQRKPRCEGGWEKVIGLRWPVGPSKVTGDSAAAPARPETAGGRREGAFRWAPRGSGPRYISGGSGRPSGCRRGRLISSNEADAMLAGRVAPAVP